ncbi:MAG: YcjX family protein [Rhodobacteraceae bacterium]|nr:YcjX family protein [Paracoccaceae bacterium]
MPIFATARGEPVLGIGRLLDDLARSVPGLGLLADDVLRLGVTGLSRAGKTVFITSLVANLLDRGRMPGLRAEAEGRIEAVWLQPQPDMTVPRFDFEANLAAMTGPAPRWPDSTRAVSELRLSFRLAPGGMLGALRGPRILHLDIVDYPGEWLLDLGLLDTGYAAWSEATLARIARRPEAAPFRAALADADPAAPFDEALAQGLARAFTAYLAAARAAGHADCTPGRFLLPGDLAGSPVLTFAPLPPGGPDPRGGLRREFARRFDSYRAQVVRPFFRDHFARVDRQVVLLDVLGAIHDGPAALEEMRGTMADILGAFRPGRNRWLSGLLGGRRVERILFAATKADHLHHEQHGRLTAILAAMMREARDRADFAGAETAAMAVAGLRTTVEEKLRHKGAELACVRGTLLSTGRQAAFYPGELPEDPARLLAPARAGAGRWLDADYGVMHFAPAPLQLRPGEGPPHIRLDRAAQFLFGDRL